MILKISYSILIINNSCDYVLIKIYIIEKKYEIIIYFLR